jgi:hypothetical protein
MIRVFSVFLCCIFCFSISKAQSQEPQPTTQNTVDVKSDSLGVNEIEKEKVISLDSATYSSNKSLDSLSISLNSISTKAINDSLKNQLDSKFLLADSLSSSFTTPLGLVNDSLNISPTGQLSETIEPHIKENSQIIDSTFNHISSNINPIDTVNFQIQPLNQLKLDTLNTSLGSLENVQETIESKTNVSLPDSLSDLKPSGKQIDQFAENRLEKLEGMQEFNEYSATASDQPQQLMNTPEELSAFENPEEFQSLASEEVKKEINELMAQKAEQLQAAQEQMTQLKSKYSKVPNSNDMSTAVKITSLQDASWKERIVLGGNFMVEKGNPLTLDIAPLIMYKINKIFWAGISGSYKASIHYEEGNLRTNSQDVIGYSALARHMITKGFFGYAEFEYKGSAMSFKEYKWKMLPKREWDPGLLIGIGKEISIRKKFKGAVILTYDFLHPGKGFSNDAFDIKFSLYFDGIKGKKRIIEN